ncbi:hypothetical protein BDD43_4277 [Mucilaginibacter gracilis]|uniref:Uncharacterized protein n=2 Tax=Mucilaginibacter gracilis TaxID=423350 RepID=A0A495J504_9SPHI|nr:hypothetical protein BDD43_4277 [Mucilaginibacter gracilis]
MLLPVDFNGEELEFEMRIQQGYVPRVEIIIAGIPVIFETDNEEQYRALVSPEQMCQSKALVPGLLQAVAEQLQVLFS